MTQLYVLPAGALTRLEDLLCFSSSRGLQDAQMGSGVPSHVPPSEHQYVAKASCRWQNVPHAVAFSTFLDI